MTVDGEAN